MDQVAEDKLKELYGQFGEVVLKLEFYQARYNDLKTKIMQALEGKPK